MAVRTHDVEAHAGSHVVQFYERDADLVEHVCSYLRTGAEVGEVLVVIATAAHRRAFEAALAAEGTDVEELKRRGALLSLDAGETLAAFRDHGEIDPRAFHTTVGGLIRQAHDRGSGVRAYGEMVSLLWEDGDVLAAIELEELWNDLARELEFSLFCSYAASAVSSPEHADALAQVCHLHSAVLDPREDHRAAAHEEAAAGEFTAEFAMSPDAPGQARRRVVGVLREWGFDERALGDAALVVSELASNAVRHARSPFSISLSTRGGLLRIVAEDLCTLVSGQELVAERTHGLGVIDAISLRWGAQDTDTGKALWVELERR